MQLSCNSRTCPPDATGKTSHRKIKETLISTLKTKLDPFKNVVNLSSKIFFRSEFKLLKKSVTFCPRLKPVSLKQYSKQTLKILSISVETSS